MTDYATFKDVPYAGATHARQCLDLYIPSSANASSRLLVWVHGPFAVSVSSKSSQADLRKLSRRSMDEW